MKPRPKRYAGFPLSTQRGTGLLAVVAVVGFLMVAAVAVLKMTRMELHSTADQVASTKAFYAAESGVQEALARLETARGASPSSTTSGYGTSFTGSTGNGSYSVAVSHDPDSTNPGRKRVLSTGTFANQQLVVDARVMVQNPPISTPCPILFSNTGTAELVSQASLVGNLFTGDIISNQDVKFSQSVAALTNATGQVRARRDFISNTAIALASQLDATLYYGGQYRRSTAQDQAILGATINYVGTRVIQPTEKLLCALDKTGLGTVTGSLLNSITSGLGGILNFATCLLFPGNLGCQVASNMQAAGHVSLCPGLYFANVPTVGLGELATPAPSQAFPAVDYDKIKNDPSTIVVTANHVPFGTWSSGTWEVTGDLVFPSSPSVRYYVEGNARLGKVFLSKDSNAAVVARGYIAARQLSLLNVSIGSLTSPITAALPLVTPVVNIVTGAVGATNQHLWLLAEDDVVIGRPVLQGNPIDPILAGLGLDGFLSSAVSPGIQLASVGLLNPVNVSIYAYSETGNVWAKTATVNANQQAKMCLTAQQDAVLNTGIGLASSVSGITS